MGIIYLVTNEKNGKKYIGQTKKDLSIRKAQHIKSSKIKNKRNKFALASAIEKYGEDAFSFVIIKEGKFNCEKLNELESFFIKEYSTIAPDGYNLTSGGMVSEWSESSKELMRKNQEERKVDPKYTEYRKIIKSILIARNKSDSIRIANKITTANQWKNPEIRDKMSKGISKSNKERFEKNPRLRKEASDRAKIQAEILKNNPLKYAEVNKKRGIGSKNAWEKIKMNDEKMNAIRKQRSIKSINLWKNPEIRDKMSKGISKSNKERFEKNPEYKKQMRDISKKQWEDPEYRKKMAETTRINSKKRWEDPEYRKKMTEIRNKRSLKF